MFISKFCKLGVHTIKSASKAPTLTSRFSNFPKADNHHLIFLRQKLFSSTADKVGDEEKKKIIRSGVLKICKKVGKETCIKGRSGVLLDIGECGRSLACSTSHDIVMDPEQYNKLPEPADEENDMLDSAFGVTETSRLGCQIIAKRNFAVDGHKPKPH